MQQILSLELRKLQTEFLKKDEEVKKSAKVGDGEPTGAAKQGTPSTKKGYSKEISTYGEFCQIPTKILICSIVDKNFILNFFLRLGPVWQIHENLRQSERCSEGRQNTNTMPVQKQVWDLMVKQVCLQLTRKG